MKKNQVLAVQLPAPCPLHCSFCRTPEHGEGNSDNVVKTVRDELKSGRYNELYLTSNGETGLSKVFGDLMDMANMQKIPVSVLCATERSVIPGLKRVEISFNQFTEKTAIRAIAKAQQLGIPVVVSVVDDESRIIDPLRFNEEFHAHAVLIRALQSEGKSKKTAGKSSVLFFGNKDELGIFPVLSYKELENIGIEATCIDHWGNKVPFLGTPVN